MTVNFKAPEGLEIIHRLVKQSDILVENFVSGKLATMGLGWEDCRKINPRLIYASITGASFLYLGRIYDLDAAFRLWADWPLQGSSWI